MLTYDGAKAAKKTSKDDVPKVPTTPFNGPIPPANRRNGGDGHSLNNFATAERDSLSLGAAERAAPSRFGAASMAECLTTRGTHQQLSQHSLVAHLSARISPKLSLGKARKKAAKKTSKPATLGNKKKREKVWKEMYFSSALAPTASKAPAKLAEGAKAAKKTSNPATSGERAERGDVILSNSSYVYRVLKRARPDTGISNKAMAILNSFVNEIPN
ncbi:hypothetical protein NMY22_g14579 [Coprinellus aureogranulatus]|nr:hypothetical protein NMY22_g14579 [Coprinellus aureogranulatus]